MTVNNIPGRSSELLLDRLNHGITVTVHLITLAIRGPAIALIGAFPAVPASALACRV
jgi:hypothetical protein